MAEFYPRVDTIPVTEKTRQDFVDLINQLTADIPPDDHDMSVFFVSDNIMVYQAPAVEGKYDTEFSVVFSSYDSPVSGINYATDVSYTVYIGVDGDLEAERTVISSDVTPCDYPSISPEQQTDQLLESILLKSMTGTEFNQYIIDKINDMESDARERVLNALGDWVMQPQREREWGLRSVTEEELVGVIRKIRTDLV